MEKHQTTENAGDAKKCSRLFAAIPATSAVNLLKLGALRPAETC